MKKEALGFWNRALEALDAAETLVSHQYNSCASRAYYAAFNAISAHFALQNMTFKKHTSLQMAVHRDMVKPGRWSHEIGAGLIFLSELRSTGDYGGQVEVMPEEAAQAVAMARRIMETIATENPQEFRF